MSLAGKIFVITGGTSGIGFESAKCCLKEHAKVYITGYNSKSVEAATSILGPNAVGVTANAASIEDSANLANFIQNNGDRVDGVFINAGIWKFLSFESVDEAHFDEIFNTNFKGAYFTIQKLLPVINDGSSIVLNASSVVNAGFPALSVYSSTKAALNSLAKTLSRDLLHRRIRVNAVNPGLVDTLIWKKMNAEEMCEQLLTKVPAGRLGKPEEIASYVTYLLSDQSSYIIGTSLTIDGGLTQI